MSRADSLFYIIITNDVGRKEISDLRYPGTSAAIDSIRGPPWSIEKQSYTMTLPPTCHKLPTTWTFCRRSKILCSMANFSRAALFVLETSGFFARSQEFSDWSTWFCWTFWRCSIRPWKSSSHRRRKTPGFFYTWKSYSNQRVNK